MAESDLANTELLKRSNERDFDIVHQDLIEPSKEEPPNTPGVARPTIPFSVKAYHPALNPEGNFWPVVRYPQDVSEQIDNGKEHASEEDSPEASFTVNLRKGILYRHRVTQPPDVDPRDDNTIKAVLEQKGVWVEKMMSAVLNLEGINDGANSKKTPSFKEGHKNFFGKQVIKNNCLLLFVTVIDRCVSGFRGWTFVDKARIGHCFLPDQIATCEQRMENVIRTLQLWKCACHDIIDLESKSWVKLANAPMGYAFEKLMNKHNNDLKAQTHKDGPKPTHGARRRGSSRGKLGINAISTPQSNSASMPIPPMAPGNSAATSFLRQAATSNRDGMPELDHHSGSPPSPFPDFQPSVYMPSNQSQFTNEETVPPPTQDVPLMSLHFSHINGPFSVSPWFPQGSVHRSPQDLRQETNGGAYTSVYNNNHVPPAIRARGYNNAYGGSRHAQGQGQAQAQAQGQYWATDHTTRFKRSQPQDPPQDTRSTHSSKKPRTEDPTPFVQEAVVRAESPDFFSSPLEGNDVGALLFPPAVLATGNGPLDSFAVTQEVDVFDDDWNKEIRRSPSHSSESSDEENDPKHKKKEHDPETGEACEECRTAANQHDVSKMS